MIRTTIIHSSQNHLVVKVRVSGKQGSTEVSGVTYQVAIGLEDIEAAGFAESICGTINRADGSGRDLPDAVRWAVFEAVLGALRAEVEAQT